MKNHLPTTSQKNLNFLWSTQFSRLINRLSLLWFFLFAFSTAFGQTPITIGTGTATQIYPLGNFYGFERSAAIYTSAEIGKTGNIIKIAWYSTKTGDSRPIKIYLKPTANATITSSTWESQIIGATLVYDGSMATTANAWAEFGLPAFAYAGGTNLLVLVEANYGGTGNGQGSSGTAVRYSNVTGKHMYFQKDNSSPTIDGTVTADRPNVQLTFSPPCSAGTPTGGTSNLSATTGGISSAFTATVAGATSGAGLSYQWQVSDTESGPWSNISGATGASANLTATTQPGTTKYYRRIITCGAAESYSASVSFTTNSPIYCSGNPATVGSSVQSKGTYIKKVSFLGTLNDVINDQTTPYKTTSPWGYQDYTSLSNKTVQAMGNGINVYVESNSIKNVNGGETNDAYYMAWIDWNKDGDFDDVGEQIYDSNAYVLSTTFGVIIPSTITPYGPGDYRLRIRINKREGGAALSCGIKYNDGETEDYIIKVIANCEAVVTSVGKVTDQFNCGPGIVSLSATASAGGITEFRWYSAETGGTLVGTSAPATDGKTTTWDTPLISSTTIYYVEAYNGTCKSLVRIPVKATIKLVPAVSFTPTVAESCGKNSVITLSAIGGNEVDYLINEDFETGGLGTFTNVRRGTSNGAIVNGRTAWYSRQSVSLPIDYRNDATFPLPQTWFPAMSSGINGNKFVMASSDVGTDINGINYIVENSLLSPQKDASKYINLTLAFKMYYSRYHPDGTLKTKDFVNVQVATNPAGTNWTTVSGGGVYDDGNITADKGIGTRFEQLTFNLNSYAGQSTLKVRILYHGEWCDGVAVDDIQLYGEKKLSPSFTWVPDANPLNFYTDIDATTLYTQGTPIEAVYIKPTLDQMESAASWNVSATATLGNGCPVAGNITVTNNNKIWNSASNDWSDVTKWKPSATLPTLNTCVIVRSPLLLSNGNGLAKNLSIQPTGSLTIKKDRTLTVTDYIKNETTINNEDQLVLESDANLIQINSGATNSGRMTAKREVKDLRYQPGIAVDYVYWSSPVAGQKTKNAVGFTDGFSPGTPNGEFFYYRESNDRFYETGDKTFTPGRGYAVRAEGSSPNTYTKTYEFKGTPNNGDISFPITRSANTGIYFHGYNLVGNPYPSNINFEKLYTANSSLIYNTAWFWTNSVYIPTQQGSTYNGNNYAVLNGTGGAPATLTFNVKYSEKIPTGIITVGQAFLVQKREFEPGSLSFKNTYGPDQQLRVSTGGSFYSRGTESKNRFWLKLQSPDDLINSQLIGYIQGATNEFEIDYDAEAFSLSSNLFYSLLGDKKLLIQGKSNIFTVDDRVQLGANFFQTGTYTIALDSEEGIFNAGQSIYLKDKQTGNIANLSEGNYTFQAVKGETNGRFEIVYKPEIVLVTDSKVKEAVVVYRDSDDFVVKAQHKKITSIEVFDVIGRLIYSLTPNSLQTFIPGVKLLNSTYVLKINQGGTITTKKIIK